MKYVLVRLCVSLSVVVCASSVGSAVAQGVSAPAAAASNNQSPAIRGLNAVVVARGQGVLLKAVIMDIAQQASLKVSFGDAVARDKRTVNISNVRGPAREVLAKVLSGTGITYTVTPSGNL